MIARELEILAVRCYLSNRPGVGAVGRRATKEDDVLSQTIDAAEKAVANGSGMKTMPQPYSSNALLEKILSSLDENKAEDVISIDLKGKSEMADFMVICSGRSTRQVVSIAEKLADTLKQTAGIPGKLEGKDQGDWVLIDAGDVIIHIFRPEVREFYQLEKMWMDPGHQATAKP